MTVRQALAIGFVSAVMWAGIFASAFLLGDWGNPL